MWELQTSKTVRFFWPTLYNVSSGTLNPTHSLTTRCRVANKLHRFIFEITSSTVGQFLYSQGNLPTKSDNVLIIASWNIITIVSQVKSYWGNRRHFGVNLVFIVDCSVCTQCLCLYEFSVYGAKNSFVNFVIITRTVRHNNCVHSKCH